MVMLNLFQHLLICQKILKPAYPAGRRVQDDEPKQGNLTLHQF